MQGTIFDAGTTGAHTCAPILRLEEFDDEALFAAIDRLDTERRAAFAARFAASTACALPGTLANDLLALIDAERSLKGLELLAHDLWSRHYASGNLSDGDAQYLAERIDNQKKAVRERSTLSQRAPHVRSAALEAGRPSHFPPKKPLPKPRCRKTAWTRKRLLAACGGLPPHLAKLFTEGQRAVLVVVGTEAVKHGACRLSLSEIMTRCGLKSPTTVRDAIRAAERRGLLSVHERRRKGLPNLTNAVEIVSHEWRAWLLRGGAGKAEKKSSPSKEVGSKKLWSTDKGSYRTSNGERLYGAQHTLLSPRTASEWQSFRRNRGG